MNSGSSSNLEQYTRLTYIVDEMVEAQSLTSANVTLQQFDIVGVTPGNFKVFSYLCNTADIDLIVLDFTHKLPFALDKKLVSYLVSDNLSNLLIYTYLVFNS